MKDTKYTLFQFIPIKGLAAWLPQESEDFIKAVQLETNKIYSNSLQNHDIVENFCIHDRVKYEGFTETYWYCSKCDTKNI